MSKAYFAHEKAMVESEDIGKDTRVWAFAHVMKGAKVGAGCNLGEHAFVEAGAVVGNGVTVKNGISIWDKVTIEDDVFLGPHMVFTNDMIPRSFRKRGPEFFVPTVVKKGASIGAGAVVVCGNTIGEYAFVAAGSVVTRPVPPHALVMGNPARQRGWICKCGDTRFKMDEDAKSRCPNCESKMSDFKN